MDFPTFITMMIAFSSFLIIPFGLMALAAILHRGSLERKLRKFPKYELRFKERPDRNSNTYTSYDLYYNTELRNTNLRSYVERRNFEEHISIYNIAVL